jgi:MFS family permease
MHGLYLLWWVHERHVSPAAVAAILAAGDLVLVAFELPTGWFADRFGHRLSLIVGSSIQTIGMAWCWLGRGVPDLIIASVLVALGDAFRSGADQALLYRTSIALRREPEFQRIEARTRAVTQIALIALTMAGGVIVTAYGFAAGWIAEIVMCATGLGIACAMVEPPKDERPIADDVPAPARARLLSVPWIALIVPAALVDGAASAAAFLAQTIESLGARDVTILVAGIAVAEAAGAGLAVRLPPAGWRTQVWLAVVGFFLTVTAFRVPSSLPAVAAMLALLFGLANPLRAAALQRLAPDAARARIASLASACSMAVKAVALPLAGLWRRRP